MSNVPTNLIPTRTTELPEYAGVSQAGYFPYVIDGRTYKVQFSQIATTSQVPPTRAINTGVGLAGGGNLTQDRTIYIANQGVGYSQLDKTGVVAGTYGTALNVPVISVDDTGRVTSVTTTAINLPQYVPTTRTITADTGLSGGGDLSANRTISINFSSATPQPLGVATAGTGTQAAREDHVHPAVDLSNTARTQGVLPLVRGGTGNALSPVAGAVIYTSGSGFSQTTSGNAGQVLMSAGGASAPFWQTVTGILSEQIDVYSTGGTFTWVKPAWASSVEVILIGGGGGGGSGRKGAAGTVRTGGAGGGGGAYSQLSFRASFLGATETVVVGAGGAGGSSQATNSTDGNAGTAGGTSSFGTKLYAAGGAGGGGGTVSGASPGLVARGTFSGGQGGVASTGAGSGTGITATGIGFNGAPYGGAGGGPATAANAAVGGGQGVNTTTGTAPGWKTGALQPVPTSSTVVGNGNSGTDNATDVWLGGESGDGGGASITGNAGNGGNGGKWGGGGGGGGGAVDAVGNSGAGGNGADGLVVVISRG